MQILVIEHLSLNPIDQKHGALDDEGQAMLFAVCRDFHREKDVQVFAAVHPRLEKKCSGEQFQFIVFADPDIGEVCQAAASSDGVLLIAPECHGIGARWAKQLEASGAALLSPLAAFVEWASDKFAVARDLPGCSPKTAIFDERSIPFDFGKDLIIKPQDGVGAMNTHCLRRHSLNDAILIAELERNGNMIVQPYVSGRSVSVAVVARSSGPSVVLPAIEQILRFESSDPSPDVRRIAYAGGIGPLAGFDERIRALIEELMNSCPEVHGWLGVDLILADDGRDVIVDVNPRLTTSYLAYSNLYGQIPARLILGRETQGDLETLRCLPDRRVRFTAAGYVEPVE